MRRNTQLIFGTIVIVVGLSILIRELFDVDAWSICFPTALILLGVWFLVYPKVLPEDAEFRLRIFGNIRKRAAWLVIPMEVWMFIGDVRLDFTETEIPPGETRFRIIAFIGDIRLRLPQNVGYSVTSMAFINEVRLPEDKRETFLVPIEHKSAGYEDQGRKIVLEAVCFISDVKVAQVEE